MIAERPPDRALRWVEAQLGPGATVDSVARLPGAASSAVHVLAVGGVEMVLRRFVLAGWLAREPYLAEREAAVLTLLAGSGVTAPELIAVDPDGSSCDVPAVLMTRLPGTTIRDADPQRLAAAAEAAAAVHAIAESPPWEFRRYNSAPDDPPPWSARPGLWERAFAEARRPAPPGPDRFIHATTTTATSYGAAPGLPA